MSQETSQDNPLENDESFLHYVSSHSTTPRALFSKTMAIRLLTLAGQIDNYELPPRDFICIDEAMATPLVDLAWARLRPPPNLVEDPGMVKGFGAWTLKFWAEGRAQEIAQKVVNIAMRDNLQCPHKSTIADLITPMLKQAYHEGADAGREESIEIAEKPRMQDAMLGQVETSADGREIAKEIRGRIGHPVEGRKVSDEIIGIESASRSTGQGDDAG